MKPETPPNLVESNSIFRKSLDAARSVAVSVDRLLSLVQKATLKLEKNKNRGPLKTVLADAGAFFRMIRAYAKRKYTGIPWESLVLVVAAVIYFVSPIDLIPDFIPIVGYVDDAAVIGFVAWSIRSDLGNFRAWEASQSEDVE